MATIFAPVVKGAQALQIVRISGSNAKPILDLLTKSPIKNNSRTAPYTSSGSSKGNRSIIPRHAHLRKLYRNNILLDEALVLFFPEPHSFTGDDCVELHLHGGLAVSQAVTKAILATDLARMAEPGEFTKTAFINGKLGLTEVEGIRDLLLAETEMQRRVAIMGSAGKVETMFNNMRDKLISINALITAEIDFAEDNHISANMHEVEKTVAEVLKEFQGLLRISQQCSEIVRHGVRIALLGAPNSGKSSLVNYLAQRDVSLVSEVAGTTRDVLEVPLNLQGNKAVMFDLAGVHETDDIVESLGIQKAMEVLKKADIIVYLKSNKNNSNVNDKVNNNSEQSTYSSEPNSEGPLYEPLPHQQLIEVSSKSDLAQSLSSSKLNISTRTGLGIEEFLSILSEAVQRTIDTSSSSSSDEMATAALSLTERVRNILETEAIPGLQMCSELLYSDIVLSHAELSRATDAIGRITGRSVNMNEVLDVVFGSFCIGK